MNNKKYFLIIFAIIILAAFFFSSHLNNKPKNLALPSQYLDDREKFGQVNQLFTDAMDLTKPPDSSNKPFDMPKDKEAQILSKLEEGVNLSKEIDDSFLDYLDPQLKEHYRNEYLRGNKLFLGGLKSDTSNENSPGVKQQLEGSRLIGEWIKWWDSNRDRIVDKAFQK